MIIVKLLTVAVLAGAVSACTINVGNDSGKNSDTQWKHTQQYNLSYVNSLQQGISLDDVKTALGTPDFSESFNRDNNEIIVLFYRTHHVKSDGKTTKNECTPLIFKQNKLAGWGDKAYQYL